MTDWFSDLNDRVSKGLLMPVDAQPSPAATAETRCDNCRIILKPNEGAPLCERCRENYPALARPFKEIEPPFNVYHQLTEIGDKNGHVCTAENGEIAKDILAALNIAARLPSREEIARILWERFAPVHHIGWADETHKAEYLAAADAVLSPVTRPHD